MRKKYDITGMSCAACSARIERIMSKKEGVRFCSVSLPANSMTVDYDENVLQEADFIAAIAKAGFGCVPKRSREEIAAERAAAEHQMKLRLYGSIALLIPLFYLGMYHMLPHPHSMEVFFTGNPLAYALAQLLLTLPICWLNRKFFINGFRNLANLSPNMDSLVAVGASAALVYGAFALGCIIYGMISGDTELMRHYGSNLYFESAGMILSLVTVGKYMEERSKGRTGTAIEKLIALAPQRVLVEREGISVEIAAEELLPGDIAIISPGAKIPADGSIIEGEAAIDESALTGESLPVMKSVGDKIYCATTNTGSMLKMRVEQSGDNTLLAAIIRLVEEAAASKAPIAALADRIALYFVPAVMGISIVTLIGWLIAGGGFERAFSCAIAVLVISCPCALGLATPLAITVSTGKSAEYGILIKSGEALQRLHEADTVVFDKTGTLTGGKPSVTAVYSPVLGENELLQAAASAEYGSEHLLAKAVLNEAAMRGIELLEQEEVQAHFGKGIEARIKGELWLLGNERLLNEVGIEINADHGKYLAKFADMGATPLLVARNGQLCGIIAISDKPKSEAAALIKALHKRKIKSIMLTGDNRRTAAYTAGLIGIDEVIAEVLPTDKEAQIAALEEQGHKVIMVGDGINDAPALKRATVGMAIGQGTDIAVEAADIVLMNDSLQDVLTALQLSAAAMRNIRQNLFWAFFYNCLGIPLASGLLYPALGLLLNPMIGAAAMSMSSLFVVGNALRLKLFKPKKEM